MIYRRLPNSSPTRIDALVAATKAIKVGKFDLIGHTLMDKLKLQHNDFPELVARRNLAASDRTEALKHLNSAIDVLRAELDFFFRQLEIGVVREDHHKDEFRFFDLKRGDALRIPKERRALARYSRQILLGDTARNKQYPALAAASHLKKAHDDFHEAYGKYVEANQSYKDLQIALRDLSDIVDEVIRELWNTLELIYHKLSRPQRRSRLRDFGVVYVSRTGVALNQENGELDTDEDNDPNGMSAPDFDESTVPETEDEFADLDALSSEVDEDLDSGDYPSLE